VDKIVENHDARVIQNNTGDVSLLWTFIDRNTLIITTNDATLREIISRLQTAPVTPIPGQ
jgi:UDP-N-acetylglucosamine transferase subunit ALG13